MMRVFDIQPRWGCRAGAGHNVPAQRSRGGFTLVETLLALALLVIMTGIVVMGVPMAFRAYTDAVDAANAQTVLTTTTTKLRGELGLSQETKVVDGKRYYRTAEGYWAWLESTDAGIKKHVYQGSEPGQSEAEGSPQLFISEAAQTDALRVQFDGEISFDEDNGVFSVDNLRVVRPNDGIVVADIGDEAGNQFKIAAIMLEEGR